MDSTEDKHIAMAPYQKNDNIVSRIPPEIWREIFVHTLPYKPPHPTHPEETIRDTFVYVHPDSSQAPLKLGLVCREWRHISTTCPDLWTSISINLGEVARPWNKNSIDHQPRTDTEELCALYAKIGAGVEQWLSRSGCLPLTIHYQEGWYPNGLEVNDARASVRETFISVASRWIHVETYQNKLVEVSLTGTRVPLLKSLVLQACFFDASPLTHLSHLSIRHPGFIYRVALFPHLKHIELKKVNFMDALGVLPKSPSLVSAKLCGTCLTSDSPLSEPIIHHLKKLSVSLLGTGAANQLWDSLTLPSLKTLEFDWEILDYRTQPSKTHCASMLLRSRCDLEHLFIGVPLSSSDAIQCLSASPNLQSLKIGNSNDQGTTASILDRLAEDDTTARPKMFTFCSKLHKLTLHDADPDHFNLDALINFLIARCHAVDDRYPPSGEILKEFELSSTWPNTWFVDKWSQVLKKALNKNALLRKCITGGLCIKITSSIGGSIQFQTKYLFGPNFPQGVPQE